MQFWMWFSNWIKFGDGDGLRGEVWWSNCCWVRWRAKRAFSSWASLSSSSNLDCSEGSDGDGGVEVMGWVFWWSCWWDYLWFSIDWAFTPKGSLGSLFVRVMVNSSCWAKIDVEWFWCDEMFGWMWEVGIGWEVVTWVWSSFRRQTGLTKILATLEVFGFWLLDEDIMVVDERR